MERKDLAAVARQIKGLVGLSGRPTTKEVLNALDKRARADGENRPFAWLEDHHGIDPMVAWAAIGGRWMDGSPARDLL